MITGYAAVPSWMIADDTISGPALLVYAALASRSGFESIHPGQALLAKEARCGERRTRDAIKELETLGVVERVQRRRRDGSRASDGYVLLSNRRPSPNAEQPAPDAGSDGQPAFSDTTNRQSATLIPLIEITTSEITTSAGASARESEFSFAEWWAFYPRKVSRGQAEKAFPKAVKLIASEGGDPRAVLVAGVQQLVEWVQVTRPEVRHIPHASTWLNGQRWADHREHMSGPDSAGMTPAEQMAVGWGQIAQNQTNHDWSANEIGR